MSKIKINDINDFMDTLTSSSRKKTTYRILNEIFSKARELNYVKVNVMAYIVDNFEDKDTIRIVKDKYLPTQEQEDKFLEFIRSKNFFLYNLAIFLIYSGLRIGEALGLEYNSDIDLDNNIIHINKIFNTVTKKIATPKTNTSIRDVPLFEKAKEAVLAIKMQNPTGRIFTILQYEDIFRRLKRYSTKLGLNITPHTFRHIFASKCYAMGIDDKIIQKWLGHASISTTLNSYVTVMRDEEIKAIYTINNHL